MARVAQARALSRVGLVDRAWARLQGLIDDAGASAESFAATAELFLARRWPKRAREVLHKGLRAFPEHQGLKDLWDRLSEPLTTPDLDAVDDAAADVPALITAAHHLIASGSHTRARTLLERAQRQDPANLHVDDMLWALDGDFSVDASLGELVTRYGPDLGALADLEEEPEHTESIRIADVLPVEERDKGGSFPNLFREQDPRTEMIPEGLFDDASDEITKVSAMLDIGGLDTIVDQTFTGEHTEIQRVISRATLVEAAASDTAFDLKALRSDLAAPELEDDELVVVTRRDDEDTTGPSGESSLLVLERSESGPPTADRRTGDEAETWILPKPDPADVAVAPAPAPEPAPRSKKTPAPVKRVEAPRPPPPPPEPLPDDDDDLIRPPNRTPMWLFAGLAVFVLGVLLLVAVIGLQWVTG